MKCVKALVTSSHYTDIVRIRIAILFKDITWNDHSVAHLITLVIILVSLNIILYYYHNVILI